MEMPVPGPAHEKLQAFVGQWSGEEQIAPSPIDTAGGLANAKVDNRLVLADFVVVQDYVQERAGRVNFEGHAVISYDAASDDYVMDWWDTFGMTRSEYRGKWSGKTLVLHATTPMGKSRATYDFGKPDEYGFKMEVSLDGKSWIPFMEGVYKRLV